MYLLRLCDDIRTLSQARANKEQHKLAYSCCERRRNTGRKQKRTRKKTAQTIQASEHRVALNFAQSPSENFKSGCRVANQSCLSRAYKPTKQIWMFDSNLRLQQETNACRPACNGSETTHQRHGHIAKNWTKFEPMTAAAAGKHNIPINFRRCCLELYHRRNRRYTGVGPKSAVRGWEPVKNEVMVRCCGVQTCG